MRVATITARVGTLHSCLRLHRTAAVDVEVKLVVGAEASNPLFPVLLTACLDVDLVTAVGIQAGEVHCLETLDSGDDSDQVLGRTVGF